LEYFSLISAASLANFPRASFIAFFDQVSQEARQKKSDQL